MEKSDDLRNNEIGDDPMKKNQQQDHDLELKKAFSGSRIFYKPDLRKYFYQHFQEASELAFRRFLYGLEKRQTVLPVGNGAFVINQATKKKSFIASWSQELATINKAVHTAFPYIQYLGWETRCLHEFMLHQPGENIIIIEAEKDVYESVFNQLSEQYPGKAFLDPDRLAMERYVVRQTSPILVSRLITQSPKKTIQGLPYPKLEKILVDIFVDDEKYYFFQGEEMVHIFKNVFSSYWISEKTLFRYAGRRKAAQRLRQFIHTQTTIELSFTPENAE